MNDIALLYVGALTPDSLDGRNEATSAAAEIFQRNILEGFSASGLPEPEVLTYVPVPAFPYPRAPLVVWGGKAQGPVCRTLGHLNLNPLKIAALGFSAGWATARWALRNRGKRKIALVYNLNAPPAAALLPICRLFGVRFVPFVGDIYVPGEVVDDGLFRRLEFWLQCRTLPKSDGLLVCNRAIVDDFAPGREALLVEGGVTDAFLDRFAAPAETVGRPFHIVFAGSLTELNGVTVLLDALKEIDDPELRVTIAGRGVGEAAEEAVREAAPKDARIDFRGLIPYEEVLALYEDADLLLSLRRTDARTERYVFPSKVVECLGTGRPLLTTATGHVRQEFGEVAYLLEELTPSALSKRLREIMALTPEERRETGMRARVLVRETRTWAGHGRRIERYLRNSVLGGAA